MLVSCLAYSYTVMMEACSSETSVDVKRATQQYIPADTTPESISIRVYVDTPGFLRVLLRHSGNTGAAHQNNRVQDRSFHITFKAQFVISKRQLPDWRAVPFLNMRIGLLESCLLGG
jgi:hypothetical protein